MSDSKFLYVHPQDLNEHVCFWKEFLKTTIDFLKSRGICQYKDLRKKSARAAIEPALWKISETNGKYHIRYYSKETWERTLKEGRLPSRATGSWNSPRAELMFEHVVERAPLIEWMLEDPSNIDIIEDVCIGCIVTKSESKLLPNRCGVDPKNVWARYLEKKIDVYDRMLDKWHILDGKLV